MNVLSPIIRAPRLASNPAFYSNAEISATIIPGNIRVITRNGYVDAGDGGQVELRRVAVAPTISQSAVRSADRYLPNGNIDLSNGGWWQIFSDKYHEKMFGAVGVTALQDTQAIQALFDYTASLTLPAYIVGRAYLTQATLNIPDGTSVVAENGTLLNSTTYHMRKQFNGDMFTLGNRGIMKGLSLDGRGSSQTGRGIVVTVGGDQKIHDCNVMNFASYNIEFIGSSVGIRSEIRGGYWSRLDSKDTVIRWPAEPANGNRIVTDVVMDGNIDCSGSDNGTIIGNNVSNILFSSTSKKIKVVGNRVSNGAIGTEQLFVVLGNEHTISANILSGTAELGSGCQNSKAFGNVVAGGPFANNSGNATNQIV